MEKTLQVKKQGTKKVLFKQSVVDESIVTVGNNPSATLELKDARIAPEQFVIINENNQLLLMNRADGTTVNDKNLELGSRVELNNGDKIEIGSFEIELIEISQNGVAEVAEIKSETKNDLAGKTVDKDFSAVLNGLKEEDSFYFQIINEENIIERVLFDSEEIWMGTSFAESAIKKDKTQLDEIFARIKKDWSGAVIYPEEGEEVYLNDVLLSEPNRLKNEDELFLVDEFAEDDDIQTKITFHEPVVLLALNSILPEDLPEPINISDPPDKSEKNTEVRKTTGVEAVKSVVTAEKKRVPVKQRSGKLFGYFSFLEVLIMAVGTLVTAAVIFLVLEFI